MRSTLLTLMAGFLATLGPACGDAEPGGDGDEDLGTVVFDRKGDLVEIQRSVSLKKRISEDTPSTRTFTLGSDVGFDVRLSYDDASEVEIVVENTTSGTSQTTGKTIQPHLTVEAPASESAYRVRLRNWSPAAVAVDLRVQGSHQTTLPEFLDLGGDTSAVAVADIDEDGLPDLAALIGQPNQATVELLVAFGDASGTWATRYRHALEGPVRRGSRDSSSSVVVVADVNDDDRLDVVTASGVATRLDARTFSWRSLGDEAIEAYQPVAVAMRGPSTEILRGSTTGRVEVCTQQGPCEALPGQAEPCAADLACPVDDMVVADFDGDGEADILAGGPLMHDGSDLALLWTSSTGDWGAPVALSLSCVDLEAADIDRDGDADLVVQQREGISDFPSYTDVLWATPGEPSPFGRAQTLYNHDNHNDDMTLADANADGCVDLLQIGVDSSRVAVRLGMTTALGCTGLLGAHDATQQADVGWTTRDGLPGTIGIQQADVNGDGVMDWILRAPLLMEPGGGPAPPILQFQPIPFL